MNSTERNFLALIYATARSFAAAAEPGLSWDLPGVDGSLRPGDDYNARASWVDILEPAGWVAAHRRGEIIYWRRPGKEGRSWSATTGRCKSPAGDLLYVFSSSADPFKPEHCYSKFGAYTLLHHSGDYKAAARALAGKGFGEQRPRVSTNGKHEAPLAEPPPWEPPIPLAAVPEAMPFPLHVLPGILQKFLREVADSKHCPVDYAALPLLTVAGGAIGASRAIVIKQGWTERPCIYAAVIAPPGSAKTPALKDIAYPVYAEQNRLRGAYRRAKEVDSAAQLRTIYISDITAEALAQVLQNNDRGVVMIRDELTSWASGMDQYKASGRGSDRQVYLHAWSGEPISVHRKMQETGPLFVAHPFLGIVGGLPPSNLAKLCGEEGRVDDGFLDRILFAYPKPAPVVGEDWRCVSSESTTYWAKVLESLWALKAEDTPEGGTRPHYIPLSRSGKKAWEKFTHDLAAQMNDEDFPEFLLGPWSKLRSYCARLALIVHCLRQACDGITVDGNEVDGESMDRAAELVAYCQSHARKVYAAFDADPNVARCRRVLRWLERKGLAEFKARDAMMDLAGAGIRNTEDLERLLSRLVKHNYLREKRIERPSFSPGRPPSPIYEVNPLEWPGAQSQKHPHPTNPTYPTKPPPEPG